ncbi:MAG: respiratory nitrate reductase subunit gamma [Candidatus Nanopelagicales bacterium]
MSTTDILLWDVLPYVTIAVFVVGLIWRYRYDQLRLDHALQPALREDTHPGRVSPIFHFGILAVVGGHIMGLLIPEAWTDGRRRFAESRITSSPSRWAHSPGLRRCSAS